MKCIKCGEETGENWKKLCLRCYKAEKKAEREHRWQNYCKERMQDEWENYCEAAERMGR
jgi:NMD protein affecting ribosome stability and mRNA decay